jgi:hypothetical protein
MSLDVSLHDDTVQQCPQAPRIFVREDGQTKAISRAEWDARYPGREPVMVTYDDSDEGTAEVYAANITHNLTTMASHAGIYDVLWRPEENGIRVARDLVEPLILGLERLRRHPEHFAQFTPSNGWGTYGQLVQFVEAYLDACQQYPDATVRVSR